MPREIRLEHTKERGRCVSMRKNDWGERLVGTSSRQQKSNKSEETVDGNNKKEEETFGSKSESGRKEDWQDALLSALGGRPRNES